MNDPLSRNGGLSLEPPPEFKATINCLRTADYSNLHFLRHQALPAIQRYCNQLRGIRRDFKGSDGIYYLWTIAVQAELYDYWGDYENAKKILHEEGTDLQKALEIGELHIARSGPESNSLLRQKLWVLVFYSHTYYRDEKMEAALKLLKRIEKRTEDLIKTSNEHCHGLMARISYSMGQVYRQLSDVDNARKKFAEAIEFTRKRLDAKVRKYAGDESLCLREREHANYVTAKACALGFSWAAYHSGELDRARGASATGCILLASTKDEIHKAYAQVVYAQVLIAVSAPVRNGKGLSDELKEALELLEPLTDYAKAVPLEKSSSPLRIVPRLYARARYVLARALHFAGRNDEAIKIASTLHQKSNAGKPWYVESGILLTRMFLAEGRAEDALAHSEELMELAKNGSTRTEQCVSSLLCRADVLMQLTSDGLIEATKLVEKAMPLSSKDPLLTALCYIYAARCYARQEMWVDAKKALRNWESVRDSIKHGHVIELGKMVAEEINSKNRSWIRDPEQLEAHGLRALENELRVWAIGCLFARYPEELPSDEQCERMMGFKRKNLQTWMKKRGIDPWHYDPK